MIIPILRCFGARNQLIASQENGMGVGRMVRQQTSVARSPREPPQPQALFCLRAHAAPEWLQPW